MLPAFLFAGTFFPVDQLPGWIQPLAWITPLWHGTTAARQLTLGDPNWLAIAGHCAYLLLWVAAGVWLAVRVFTAAAGHVSGLTGRLGAGGARARGAGMARMLVERNTRAFRYAWPVLVSGFFEPVFYLFSLGSGWAAWWAPSTRATATSSTTPSSWRRRCWRHPP